MTPFSKYTGCGNDFIIIDNRTGCFLKEKSFIQKLCDRNFGIGADGILLLEESEKKLTLQIFNSDGSEAEMCGNGLRCFTLFLQSLGLYHPHMHIATKAGPQKVEIVGNQVKISLPSPRLLALNQQMGESLPVHHVNVGNPHAILFVKDCDQENLEEIALRLQKRPEFPESVNVSLVSKTKIRTFERGVQKETLACGTGVVAAALAAASLFCLSSPLSLTTKSGENLQVSFIREGKTFHELSLTGPAQRIFQGTFHKEDISS